MTSAPCLPSFPEGRGLVPASLWCDPPGGSWLLASPRETWPSTQGRVLGCWGPGVLDHPCWEAETQVQVIYSFSGTQNPGMLGCFFFLNVKPKFRNKLANQITYSMEDGGRAGFGEEPLCLSSCTRAGNWNLVAGSFSLFFKYCQVQENV